MYATKLKSAFIKYVFVLITLFLANGSFAFAESKLVFLTEEWKPFNFMGNEKEVDGFTTTIVEKIAAELETEISISILPWSRSYNSVLSHDNQAIFSIYRTPQRESLFKWVGPVYSVDTVLWGLESKDLKIEKLEDAKNYRIVVQKDSAYEEFLKKTGFKNLEMNTSRTESRMVLMGRSDLVPLSAFSIDKLQQAKIDLGMQSEKWKAYAILYSKPVYIAFNKNTSDEVVQSWQASLEKLKSSSLFSELKSKYIKPILNYKLN